MDLEQHLHDLGALLDIERAAEVERFAAFRERLSLREREARGSCSPTWKRSRRAGSPGGRW